MFYGANSVENLVAVGPTRLSIAAGSHIAPKPRIQPATMGIAYSSYFLMPTVLITTNFMIKAIREVIHMYVGMVMAMESAGTFMNHRNGTFSLRT